MLARRQVVTEIEREVFDVAGERAGAAGWTATGSLRYTFRKLRQQPRVTAFAVACLALGIGANTGFFSVIDAALLQPLPYGEPDRLVMIWQTWMEQQLNKVPVSAADLQDYRDQARQLDGLVAISPGSVIFSAGDFPERIYGCRVSAGVHEVLQTEPVLGRGFRPEEGQPGGERVVVLSHSLWQRSFGGRPEVLGSTVRIDAEPHVVIGVMPAGFFFMSAELWVPLTLDAEQWSNREHHFLWVVARLTDGVTRPRAEAELKGIAGKLERLYPDANAGIGVRLQSLREALIGDHGPTLTLLFWSSALVLLLACANMAHLLLAVAADRRRELAVRAALGAGRLQLLRQLLLESLVLAQLGGLAGLVLAAGSVKVLAPLAAGSLPAHAELGVDLRVLAYTVVVSALAVLLFGLVPALIASRTDLSVILREGAHGSTAGLGRLRLGNALSVTEIALALVLAIAAGLLLQSLSNLQDVEPGFRPQGVLTMRLNLPKLGYHEPHQVTAFSTRLLAAVEALPGVTAAGVTASLPYTGFDSSLDYNVEGRPPRQPEETPFFVNYRLISPGYLETMEIPLLAGRPFAWSDAADTPGVVIVNEALARRFWPDEEPLGQRIRAGDAPDTDPWLRVVGVAGDVVTYADAAPNPAVYRPCPQDPGRSLFLVVRSDTAETADLVPQVRQALARIDPDLPLFSIRTMPEWIAYSLSRPRLGAVLLSLFTGLGLLLAALGVYGSFRYAVSRRRRELAIRQVLGAGRRQLLLGVLAEGLQVALVGTVLGLAAAWLGRRLVDNLLFGVAAGDPLAWLGAALLLLAVVALAVLLPALRATRVDPAAVLRD